MQMTLVQISIIQSTVSLWCCLHSVLFPWLVLMRILYCVCAVQRTTEVYSYPCVTFAKEHSILPFDVFWHVMLSLFTKNPPTDNRRNSKLILCIKKTTTLNTFITGAVAKCMLQSQEKASV